ncbi:hypothetical protein RRG08_005528 [Elysia crispata]|uniref:Ig-like domain-containing protein n=1 Tax=Elysia crispata TaxID=231223 RepID=A0AAE0XRJ3_9GAST|nr:hypothetical protein RRG08_005528 [Elysia crispata]
MKLGTENVWHLNMTASDKFPVVPAKLFYRYDSLVMLIAFVACFHRLGFGFPFREMTPPIESKTERYRLYNAQGDKVKIQCDARMVGYDANTIKVVWALTLRRLSRAGCNPKDPVLTLAEIKHSNGSSKADQIYKTIREPPHWKLHAQDAALGKDMSNILTAWIGLSIKQARLEDSGVYRCDAVAGEQDGSKVSKSSYTTVIVSAPDDKAAASSAVSEEQPIASANYDSSVVKPMENHRRVGQTVNITCAPRLLRSAPLLPFSVSQIIIRFLPFHLPDVNFVPVAVLDLDTFYTNPLPDRKWEFSYVGITQNNRKMDSLLMRIDIGIPSVSIKETGIFRCSVTEDLTGKIYEGEAGLKVSNVSDFRSGFCKPPRHDEEEVLLEHNGKFKDQILPVAFDLGLEADAISIPLLNMGNDTVNIEDDPACFVAILLIAAAVVLLLLLAGDTILRTIYATPGDHSQAVLQPVEPKAKSTSSHSHGRGSYSSKGGESLIEVHGSKVDGEEKKKKKKKKKKKEKKKDKEEENQEGGDATFTMSHLDCLTDFLYEVPCIPLTGNHGQTTH